MKKTFSLIALGMLLVAITAFTLPIASAINFKGGENVTLEEAASDDTYLAGANITVNKDVNGDLYVAGANITINGNVAQDLVVFGGTVNVMGNVGDDVRVFGGNLMLNGNVGDNVILGGGQVDIGKDVVIGGELVLGGGMVNMNGEVKEGITGGAGALFLNGTVGKDVVVTVQEKLEVSTNAKVAGEIKYSALTESKIPEGVAKSVTFNQLEKKERADLRGVTFAFIGYEVVSYLSALLIALIMVLTVSRGLIKLGAETKQNIFKTFGIGAGAFIAAFLVSILLMVTVIGIPLGVIMLVMTFVAMYLAKVFAAVIIATLMFGYEKTKKHLKLKLFLGIALGLAIFYAFSFVPIIGWLFYVFFFFVAIGAMIMMKKHSYTYLVDKKQL